MERKEPGKEETKGEGVEWDEQGWAKPGTVVREAKTMVDCMSRNNMTYRVGMMEVEDW